VKDITLIKKLQQLEISDKSAKKLWMLQKMKILGSELNKNIIYLLDKELLIDGL